METNNDGTELYTVNKSHKYKEQKKCLLANMTYNTYVSLDCTDEALGKFGGLNPHLFTRSLVLGTGVRRK